MGKWLGALLVLAFYVWVIRGGITLQRILDNPRDARRFRHRKPTES